MLLNGLTPFHTHTHTHLSLPSLTSLHGFLIFDFSFFFSPTLQSILISSIHSPLSSI